MIHPSAYIHPSAQIHESVVIGPWCLIDANVKIDAGVVLESRVHLYEGVSIGTQSHIYDGAILGAPPQDLKYAGEKTELKIGNSCIVREYCTINRGTVQGGGQTIIEDNVLLMAYSHIAHDCFIQEGAVVSNGCQIGGHVHIGRFATLGGNVGVQQKNQIGAYSFVGATLKVDKDVPPASRALGTPLKWSGLNLHALKLHSNEFPKNRIEFIDKAYRNLYRGKKSMQDVIADLKKDGDILFKEFFYDNWSNNLIRP